MAKAKVTDARYESSTETIRSVPENYWLASMNSFDGAVDHESNARIMAASFAMLEALEAVTDLPIDDDGNRIITPTDMAAIWAAIAKAKEN